MKETQPNEGSSRGVAGQFLRFSLGDECYGLSINHVQEIVPLNGAAVTPVPGAASYLCGIFNLRGTTVPLIELRNRFAMPAEAKLPKRCALMVESQVMDKLVIVGFVVDQVIDVVWLQDMEIKSAPQFCGKLDTHYVDGLSMFKNEVIILINSEKIIEFSRGALAYASTVKDSSGAILEGETKCE
ncbi:MAG: purine-binding chemotaxis protein CheW [Deltaproteobacteria bacterium]|nr:purine-binding chemotaxis protein CheW [Deltaproteobacteria bacterium]